MMLCCAEDLVSLWECPDAIEIPCHSGNALPWRGCFTMMGILCCGAGPGSWQHPQTKAGVVTMQVWESLAHPCSPLQRFSPSRKRKANDFSFHYWLLAVPGDKSVTGDRSVTHPHPPRGASVSPQGEQPCSVP